MACLPVGGDILLPSGAASGIIQGFGGVERVHSFRL